MTVEQRLLKSLARYVQASDSNLSHDMFLRSVVDRIVNDLSVLIQDRKGGLLQK
jgi:hypothetical protein